MSQYLQVEDVCRTFEMQKKSNKFKSALYRS